LSRAGEFKSTDQKLSSQTQSQRKIKETKRKASRGKSTETRQITPKTEEEEAIEEKGNNQPPRLRLRRRPPLHRQVSIQ